MQAHADSCWALCFLSSLMDISLAPTVGIYILCHSLHLLKYLHSVVFLPYAKSSLQPFVHVGHLFPSLKSLS